MLVVLLIKNNSTSKPSPRKEFCLQKSCVHQEHRTHRNNIVSEPSGKPLPVNINFYASKKTYFIFDGRNKVITRYLQSKLFYGITNPWTTVVLVRFTPMQYNNIVLLIFSSLKWIFFELYEKTWTSSNGGGVFATPTIREASQNPLLCYTLYRTEKNPKKSKEITYIMGVWIGDWKFILLTFYFCMMKNVIPHFLQWVRKILFCYCNVNNENNLPNFQG